MQRYRTIQVIGRWLSMILRGAYLVRAHVDSIYPCPVHVGVQHHVYCSREGNFQQRLGASELKVASRKPRHLMPKMASPAISGRIYRSTASTSMRPSSDGATVDSAGFYRVRSPRS